MGRSTTDGLVLPELRRDGLSTKLLIWTRLTEEHQFLFCIRPVRPPWPSFAYSAVWPPFSPCRRRPRSVPPIVGLALTSSRPCPLLATPCRPRKIGPLCLVPPFHLGEKPREVDCNWNRGDRRAWGMSTAATSTHDLPLRQPYWPSCSSQFRSSWSAIRWAATSLPSESSSAQTL